MLVQELRNRLIERAIARRDKLYAVSFDLGPYPRLKVQAAAAAHYRCEAACALIEASPELESLDTRATEIRFLCSSGRSEEALAKALGNGFSITPIGEEEALGFPYSLQASVLESSRNEASAKARRSQSGMAFLLLLSRLLLERCGVSDDEGSKALIRFIDARIEEIGRIDFVFSMEGPELVAYPAGSNGAAEAEREGRGLYMRSIVIKDLRPLSYDGLSLFCKESGERFKMKCCVEG